MVLVKYCIRQLAFKVNINGILNMKWTEIYDIAISLEDKYPNEIIESIKFTDLQKYVMSLEEFDDDPKRCNERILEAIQGAWLKERAGL